MDHISILKRSWEIMWRYRALWVFGIILALATAGGTGGGGGNSGTQFSGNGNDNTFQPFSPGTPGNWGEGIEAFGTALIVFAIAFVCVMVILGIITFVLGYISRTALIRMVDEYEETEERHTVGEGFRIGWSRATLRIFLIDLIVTIPLTIAIILLILLSLSPLLLWITENNLAGILGTVTAIGLFFLMILVAIAAGAIVSVLRRFFHRVVVLEGLGVFESIAAGFRIARNNFKDTALMWLMLLGLQIAYSIGTAIIGFLLFIPALVLGGGIVLLFGGFGSLLETGAWPWVLGGILGLPVFILIFALPLTFLSGLKEVYINNAWTLTYRELRPIEGVQRMTAGGEEAIGQDHSDLQQDDTDLPEEDSDLQEKDTDLPEEDSQG